MKPWAVVPVKRFDRGKSRLGDLLDPSARAELARSMFDRVVGEVLGELVVRGELAGTLVITDDDQVAARATQKNAEPYLALPVAPGRPLSLLIDEALAHLAARQSPAALVIMADLPKLEPNDIRALVTLLDSHDLVLAPDTAQTGTNALALHLPAPMPTRFRGGDSLADHIATARERDLRFTLCQRPGLAFDVDRPSDYARLRA